MILARVVGTVVATRKDPRLEGKKLLIVKPVSPEGKDETKVRDMLSRRYDLCDWTVVSTATLLTARDKQDTARWT